MLSNILSSIADTMDFIPTEPLCPIPDVAPAVPLQLMHYAIPRFHWVVAVAVLHDGPSDPRRETQSQ